MERKERRRGLVRSLQFRLTLGYALIIAVLLVLLNIYPPLTTQNLMFRARQAALENQTAMVINSLTTADELTAETLERAIAPLDELDVQRILVTNEAGVVLYDTGSVPAVGKYALTGEVVAALRGNDAFSSRYRDGVFYSRAASPIMTRGTVVGAVYLWEEDHGQGALLEEIRRNLRIISVVVAFAVMLLFLVFSGRLTRRVNTLLGGIRTVRAGEYTHRVAVRGTDELAELAEEFNQLTSRLQTTEEERRRFVSDASHELKTPLASIRLLTDSILQDPEIDRETTMDFVTDIGEAADRLIHISQELLELNRLDAGRTVIHEPVNVNEQAEQTCRMLQPLAQEARVSLYTRLGKNCVACCNPEDVNQIFRNLLENAIKYNLPGGSVTITTERRQDKVLLEVEDTGVGIPQEERDRIFERFYRVDKARSRAAGGTGLGLSIVRDTVRAHGGEIVVESGKESGTCFTVTLPAWTEEVL